MAAAGGERLEDIFQDEVVTAFASIVSFKKFARSSRGLCLDEYEIQQITDNVSDVEEQKLHMLQKWRENTGSEATAFLIRSILRGFLHPESEDYVCLSEEYGFNKNSKICAHSLVYIGEHHSPVIDSREVVVKLVEFNEKNKREVKNLRRLGTHRNVVTMLHYGVHNSGFQKFIYIVMESCRPENLGDYFLKMKELGISIDEYQKKAVIKQFLEGLEFIHFNDLIHRDIKPQNLLISQNGKFIKICDYGLTKQLSHGCSNTSQSISNPGTDGFRAPETYLHDVISQKSDVYSAGLVSYTIVSDGEHAFGNDPQKWNSYIKANKNRSLSHTTIKEKKPMKSLLEQMLQPNPRKRPAIAEVLRNDILMQAMTNLQLDSVQEMEPVKDRFNNKLKDGKMTAGYSEEFLPGLRSWHTIIITYSFPSGQIEGTSYPARNFTAYLPCNKIGSELVFLLEKAFNAGKVFKLRVVKEDQGIIVWNDIPHKMSKTGGPENNGYPDEDYLKELYRVLKSKGFSDANIESWLL